jgi:hypothetical protein
MDGNYHISAGSRWDMLFRAIGNLWGTAKRALKSHWEMSKDYWKASGQFLKGYGKAKAIGKYLKTLHRPIGEEAKLPNGYWPKTW